MRQVVILKYTSLSWTLTIPYILLFSKPPLRAAPPRYCYRAILHLRPHRVGQATTTLYVSSCQAERILLLQRSCKPFIISSVTSPSINKYIRSQDPVVLCACAFFELYCWVPFRRQSPEDVVVRASASLTRLKRILFFVNSRTFSLHLLRQILRQHSKQYLSRNSVSLKQHAKQN